MESGCSLYYVQFPSNTLSRTFAAVLSELFRKWLYMSVVVLVLAWPARPATVTRGTPAAICIVMFVCRRECTVLFGSPAALHILCTHDSTVDGQSPSPFSLMNTRLLFTHRSPSASRQLSYHSLYSRSTLVRLSDIPMTCLLYIDRITDFDIFFE